MKRKLLCVALMSVTASAYAMDSAVDPRSIAMGGGGVASANGMNAIYVNPGMLPGLKDEAFTLEAPLAFRLLNGDTMKNNVDGLNIAANAMTTALNNFQIAPSQATAAPAAQAMRSFDTAMQVFGSDTILGNGYAGLMTAMPGRQGVSWALQAGARLEFGGKFNYSTADSTEITNLATQLDACAANPVNCVALAGVNNGQLTNLTSTFSVVGAGIGEVGLALASHTDIFGGLDIGVTPKLLSINTFDQTSSAQSGNTSATSTNGTKQKESAFTLDVGAAKSFPVGNGNELRTGLMVKNLVPKTVKTPTSNVNVNIAPQVTAGIAYSTGWFNGVADIDLIKNKALIEGLSPESQFLRLGAELDAGGWAQVRVGYRHDLKGNYSGLGSVGLGLNLKLFNLDLALAAASKKEVVASVQIGTHF